jgi:2'-5' RNA ligase
MKELENNESAATSPKRVRLFIAVNLPAALKNRLGDVQREMASRVHERAVRWTRAEQLHITLKFLGYVAETSIPDIQNSLQSATNGIAKLELRAEGLGCFPSVRSPRVIWTGIQGELAALAELQKRIENATIQWAEPEAREFTPHLTLGRVKDARRKDREAIAKFVEARKGEDFGDWRVEKVDLMQSVVSSTGPTYIFLSSAILA